DRATFKRFRQIVYEKSGISLGENKEALVAARVGKRMRALSIHDYRSYLERVVQDDKGEEIVHLLDAISTNVTSFFRESDHFDFLKRAVSEWLAHGQRRFRFWSAACSTGEEPYSLAMVLLEAAEGRDIDLRILGTDISTRVLDACRAGVYDEEKIKDVPVTFRGRYFDRLNEGGAVFYAVKKTLKKMTIFKRLNLAIQPFPMKGPFDAVLCRNVMIYFDNETRGGLVDEIYRLLKHGGYLIIGHAESLMRLTNRFKLLKPSIYVKQ
ncbi:MAG: protein-glutamate O-methyltransferase, partial [Deltaproteobacteria bacterium]|nr:protein-glutamate O-methyltransferase [Deltaproteobacteria bacterium]